MALIVWLGLASVGHDFQLHSFYVNKLIKIFEYGRKKVVKVELKIKERRRKLSRIMEERREDNSEDEQDSDDLFDDNACEFCD